MNRLYGNEPTPVRYNPQQYLQGGRVGYQSGQLVDHGPGRQGYAGTRGTKMYLVDYSFDEMIKDLNAGKLKREIAQDIYNKNPKYFDDLPSLKGATGRPVSKVTNIVQALSSRIRYNPDLVKLDLKNIKNFEKLNNTALKDIKSFAKKNAAAYKKMYESNKIGAVDSFKEKILDYASQKYPRLMSRSAGTKNLPANQRLFTPFSTLGREVTRAGEYGLEKELNRLVRKGIGIPERPLKGEGQSLDRMRRNYNADLTKNLKKAQDLGVVPKIDPITKNPINTEHAYGRYVERRDIDPIRKLFGNNYKFGQEHVGGVARARVINDVESLNRITAMETFANKSLKGGGVDKTMANLMRLAKQSSGKTAQGYLDSINKISAETDKRFGLDSPKYKLVNNEIKAVYSKGALDDSPFGQAKRALKTFTATERYKAPNFKLLDKDLQKSIMALKKGDVKQSDELLKAVLQTAKNVKGSGKVKAVASIATLVGGYTADKLLKEHGISLTQDENEKVLEAGMLPGDLIQEHPVTSTLGAAATLRASKSVKGDPLKKVRRFHKFVSTPLKKLIRSAGTPLAGAGFAGWQIYDNLKAGESVADAVVDPIVGAELAFPSLFKENISKIIPDKYQNIAARTGRHVLGLGDKMKYLKWLPRAMGPVGVAVGAAGSVYDAYKDYERRKEFLTPERKREAQKESFDKDEPMFKSGGKVDYDNYLPGIDDDK
jgi:hypothetical protein